jgi:hypothetical protein
MKTFDIQDVQGSQRFPALTQEEAVTIDELISNCNEHQSQITGFIETRRNVLHKRFDRASLVEYIQLVPHFDKDNKFMVMLMKNLIEKVGRDMVREYMVEDIVASTKMKLEACNGDVEKVADLIEKYLRCGKIVPMAQTWKERLEEIEEGKVLYYEPKTDRAI